MSEIKDGGPAFPSGETVTEIRHDGSTYAYSESPGMSLRDYFASKAMTAFLHPMYGEDLTKHARANLKKECRLADDILAEKADVVCETAYAYADAMLRARGN